MDMAVIESLPNLIEITGLYPHDQSDDKFLDKLFASCGHSLKKLWLIISDGGICPRALKRNSTLRELKLEHRGGTIISSTVIELCKEKNPGFKLTIEGSLAISVDEYVEIVKQCPNSIIQMNVDSEDCDFGSVIDRVFNS